MEVGNHKVAVFSVGRSVMYLVSQVVGLYLWFFCSRDITGNSLERVISRKDDFCSATLTKTMKYCKNNLLKCHLNTSALL